LADRPLRPLPFRGSIVDSKSVIPKRYTIVVENRQTGIVRQFDIRPRPLLGAVAFVLLAPILFALAVRLSTEAELHMLRDNTRTLEIENASFRQATAELTGQITSLQETVNDLSSRSKLDPLTAKSVSRLPSSIRNQSVGGGLDTTTPIRSALSPAFAPEDTFGVIRDLLGRLEDRLQLVRTDVEKRSALAAATPSIWPAHGWVSAWFGLRRDPFTGGEEFHTGIDISTDKGRPVYATGNGTVTAASYNGSYGNQIVIDHGFGLGTRYSHLSGFAVKPGDKVTKGEVIGYVGATGRATGPHLHYEVLVNGQLVNPIPLITEPHSH
jgi:murein DD-endopeptidase MepM/ murein hydrolase activator NlpD